MIILQATDTAQEITVYAREHTATTYTVTVIDEGLNSTTSTADVDGVYVDGLLTLDISYDFLTDSFYAVQIYADSKLIAFHKIYITNQDLEKYSVLDDYYTQINKANTTYITKPTI